MGELRFSGLSSGIDTTSLVQQLLTIESRRLATYQVSKLDYEKQTTALDELRSSITALKSAAAGLSDIDTMQLFTANSSDKEILGVAASSNAAAGSHTVDVDQLATAENWIQNTSTFSYKTDYVGGGDFIYTYNNQQRVITTVENDTTLQDLVVLINKDDNNPGVSASLLYQGGKYHLMLSGQETGEDYQISIDTSTREVWKPDENQPDSAFTIDGSTASLTSKIINMDQFSGTLGASDKIIISGKNHDGSSLPDTELEITSETTLAYLLDAINEHFDGTATARLENGQIWLTDDSTGASGLEISLTFSGDAALELPTMAVSTEGGTVENPPLDSLAAASFIETQDASNSKVRIDGYPSELINEVQTLTITGGIPTTGTFRLTFNGQTTGAIAYNATAGDIETALLALDGIEAGDISVGGSDLPAGDIAIEFTGNLAGTDVSRLIVSDDGSMDAGVVSVTETTKGNDGWLHRNSNSISDALEGITLSLQDVTDTNSPVKITVTRNTTAITQKIQSLVTAYNQLLVELKDKTEYNTETEEMGILNRNMAATFLKTQMKSPFTSIAEGFLESIDDFVQATDIGLTVNGAGELEFDSSEFSKAINDNYKQTLELLGATKSGSSSHSSIEFYSSSDKYTSAGVYHVKIEVDENNEIVSAKIKLSSESEYRDAESWNGNIITFDSSFDENHKPANPEHSLQLRVNLQQGTYGTDENPVTIRLKQGMFGKLEDTLTELLEKDGSYDAGTAAIEEKISRMEAKIEKEEARLERFEERLVAKYARLEKILTTMQQQMGAVSAMLGQ